MITERAETLREQARLAEADAARMVLSDNREILSEMARLFEADAEREETSPR